MEQINNTSQPISNQPVSQPPNKSAPLKDKTFLIFAIVIGIILLILTAIILVISLSKPKPETLPTSLIQPIVIPTAMPTIDETADWETYTNKNYGFSFKYPSLWKLEENSTNNDYIISLITDISVQLPNEGAGGVINSNYRIHVINEIKNPNKEPLSEIIKKETGNNLTLIEKTIGQYRVFQATDSPSMIGRSASFIEDDKKSRFIRIDLSPYGSWDNQEKAAKLFDQILFSFKFLP